MRKRTNYISFRSFQAKYIWMTILTAFSVAIISFILVSFTIYSFVKDFEYRGPDHGVVMQQLVALAHDINISVLLGFLVLFPMIAVISMFISHRLSGPLVRIKRVLQDLNEGVLTKNVALRDKDALGDIAGEINKLLDQLRSMEHSQ